MLVKIKTGSVSTRIGVLGKGAHTVADDVGAELIKFGLASEIQPKTTTDKSDEKKTDDSSGKA